MKEISKRDKYMRERSARRTDISRNDYLEGQISAREISKRDRYQEAINKRDKYQNKESARGTDISKR